MPFIGWFSACGRSTGADAACVILSLLKKKSVSMRKMMFVMIATLVLALPKNAASQDIWREASRACVFGSTAMGAASLLVLYPALALRSTSLSIGSLMVGNALFGCVAAMAGAVTSYGFSWAYDQVFEEEPPVCSKP
ncbi:membrane hypothetical protein [Azospirillaceae bacterium]